MRRGTKRPEWGAIKGERRFVIVEIVRLGDDGLCKRDQQWHDPTVAHTEYWRYLSHFG
jgi:hypothetical protein